MMLYLQNSICFQLSIFSSLVNRCKFTSGDILIQSFVSDFSLFWNHFLLKGLPLHTNSISNCWKYCMVSQDVCNVRWMLACSASLQLWSWFEGFLSYVIASQFFFFAFSMTCLVSASPYHPHGHASRPQPSPFTYGSSVAGGQYSSQQSLNSVFERDDPQDHYNAIVARQLMRSAHDPTYASITDSEFGNAKGITST